MEHDEKRIDLKKIGFCREGSDLSKLANKGIIAKKDLSGKSINHTILRHTKIEHTNFDQASITGSIFEGCHFEHCSMDQTDFEYCEFTGGLFTGEKPIISSFNNSNFVGVTFDHSVFESSTLTGTYFEDCFFNGVTIKYTTMENANFKNCTFQDMNLRNLNMDYVELEKPVMRHVILPISQIAHMFGALQYCLETTDEVFVSQGVGQSISAQKFAVEILPVLKQHFIEAEEWFPLCNICLALGEIEEAIPYLKRGLTEVVSRHDYRMIKFYCRLISYSKSFSAHSLQGFYHLICRLNQGDNQVKELRNFVRNIGEIKELLFKNTRPTLHISFITNLTSVDTEKLGVLINKLFSIAKLKKSSAENDVEFLLTENSPIIIEAQICGETESLQQVLATFVVLSNLNNNQELVLMDHLYKIKEELRHLQIEIMITEYYTSWNGLNASDNYFYNIKNNASALIG